MFRKTPELICALQDTTLYNHTVSTFSIIETHISWVILTGNYAYKIKKPVDFGFIDFTTLDKRRYYCEEELRLNRRFAPDLYLETVAIRGSHANPQLGGKGETIEYAVKMREFSQDKLLSSFAEEKRLESKHIGSMATVIGDFHSTATVASVDSLYGTPEIVSKWSDENFQHIEIAMPESELPGYFDTLKYWYQKTFDRLKPVIQQRHDNGFVRECHGDLHLGNIAFLDNQCTPFDCIEFNDELRWIDTMSEVAFVVMDLQARGYEEFAWLFLNRYLAISGDYSGLALLPYYIVYRAMVRAKVEALRAVEDDNQAFQQSRHYLDLAQSWSKAGQPAIFVMHGLSGSGKSTVAESLALKLHAIQIRSDVERQRLFKHAHTSESAPAYNQGIYDADASKRTYEYLAELAEPLLLEGFKVIIDAACLKTVQRILFKQIAEKRHLPCWLISCQAPIETLKSRIRERLLKGTDPSEANQTVLLNQIKNQDILNETELRSSHTIICNQSQLSNEQMETIKAVLAQH